VLHFASEFKVRYRRRDIMEFIERHVRQSTSEVPLTVPRRTEHGNRTVPATTKGERKIGPPTESTEKLITQLPSIGDAP
jgi:hypothetical protein